MVQDFSQTSVLNSHIQVVSTGTEQKKQFGHRYQSLIHSLLKWTTQVHFQSQYFFTLPRNLYFTYYPTYEWGYFIIKSSQCKLTLPQMIYHTPVFNVERREAL